MDKNYLVTKSNYFIMNSSYDLSLEEQKIILTLASMVQPADEEFKSYKFRIADFMELVGVEDKSKYSEIPKITKELMKKVFEIQEGKKLIQTAWLSGAVYEKGTGYVELTFSPYLKPYMLQLKEKFTQYQLANVLAMKSKYSPRIYEILKCNEFKKQGYIEIEIEDLRKLIKADNVYPKYNDFKRYIIERTQNELRKITDINFEFEEIKTGRKVTKIRFYIHSNKNKNLNESSVTFIESIENNSIENFDIESRAREVFKILNGYKIRITDAIQIYNNANGDIEYIRKVYEYSKTQNISNIIGFMKKMVIPGVLKENIRISKEDVFNGFQQRQHNDSSYIDKLEKKLLKASDEKLKEDLNKSNIDDLQNTII